MNSIRPGYTRALDLKHGQVDMSHGAGGRAMAQLINDLFAAAFDNDYLAQGNDGALLPPAHGRLVMATDSHVVSPLFFAGGDIGCLSVHGTINDVAVMGAHPLYLAASFILEEGFPLADLGRIIESMAHASREAGVPIVTGDTKVVEQGKGDGVFITTTGVGVAREGITLSGDRAQPGDQILLSGTIGDHGMAILSQREGLEFEAPITSDTAALHGLIAAMLDSQAGLRVLRDPTRGGLATTLIVLTLATLRTRGLTSAGLAVDADNPTGALGLYERLGFEVAKRYAIYERRIDGPAAGGRGSRERRSRRRQWGSGAAARADPH